MGFMLINGQNKLPGLRSGHQRTSKVLKTHFKIQWYWSTQSLHKNKRTHKQTLFSYQPTRFQGLKYKVQINIQTLFLQQPITS